MPFDPLSVNSQNYNNQRRDLTDMLSTLIAKMSNFLSLFPFDRNATNRKVEWLQLAIAPRSITATAIAGATGVLTVTEDEAKKAFLGQLITLDTDPAVFRVTNIGVTTVTVAFVASNGSSITATTGLPAGGAKFKIVSAPMPEASLTAEQTHRQSGTDYNYTQIFRKDFTKSDTSQAIGVFGNENSVSYQEAHAIMELLRDLNRAAILGTRIEPTSQEDPGAMGGLTYFGTKPGSMSINAAGNAIDDFCINDAAQAIIDAGGTPDVVILNPGQQRVVSTLYQKQLNFTRPEEARGTYVANIATQSSGNFMRLFQEYDIFDTEAWVVDSSCFGFAPMTGRGLVSSNSTNPALDGTSRKVITEATTIFRNANQRICRIYGLKSSIAALNDARG